MKYLYLAALFSFSLNSASAQDSLKTALVNGKKVIEHKVQQGQTLYAISRKYGIPVSEIQALNPSASQIKTGTTIYVPLKESKITTPPAPETDSETPPARPESAKRGTDEHEDHIHKVLPGETLYKISKMYNVTVSELTEANQIGSGGIKTGQELIIPSETQKPTAAAGAPPTDQKSSGNMVQPVKTEKKTSHTGYPSITESGTAKLDASMPSETYQVLHKSARPGTLVMLKSKESGLFAHARVAGNCQGPELVIVNNKVFQKLEGKANKLSVEVYYTPEDGISAK